MFKRAPIGHMKPQELDLARIVVHKKGLEIPTENQGLGLQRLA